MKQTIVIGILCIIVGVVIFKSCQKKSDIKDILKIQTESGDSSKFWKDKFGMEHLQKLQVEGDKASLSILYGRREDSLSAVIGINKKQLESFGRTTSQLKIQVNTITKLVHDTISGVSYTGSSINWKDSFTAISGFVSIPDSTGYGIAELNYTSNITLDYTYYWRRKHKFLGIRYGEKIDYQDIKSPNPDLHLVNADHIVIKAHKDHFSIGPSIGVTYDGVTKPYIGIGLTYNLINF